MRTSSTVLVLPLAAALALGVTACTAKEGPTAAPPTTTVAPTSAAPEQTPSADAPSEEPKAEETTSEAPAEAAPGKLVTADFAREVTTPGEKLTTITAEGYTVDVYQVGVEKATKDGLFADPDTNKPLIAKGDDIVFVNYVVTNTSGKDIPLSISFVSISARYADWQYLQGMDTITDADLYAKLKVNDEAYKLGLGDAPYVWKSGTSYSSGENFKYQKGSDLEITVNLTPSDTDGELDHDKAFPEVKVTTKIK